FYAVSWKSHVPFRIQRRTSYRSRSFKPSRYQHPHSKTVTDLGEALSNLYFPEKTESESSRSLTETSWIISPSHIRLWDKPLVLNLSNRFYPPEIWSPDSGNLARLWSRYSSASRSQPARWLATTDFVDNPVLLVASTAIPRGSLVALGIPSCSYRSGAPDVIGFSLLTPCFGPCSFSTEDGLFAAAFLSSRLCVVQ
ncbi:unnamed protein product, partial [Protopolystoma xenopodis]